MLSCFLDPEWWRLYSPAKRRELWPHDIASHPRLHGVTTLCTQHICECDLIESESGSPVNIVTGCGNPRINVRLGQNLFSSPKRPASIQFIQLASGTSCAGIKRPECYVDTHFVCCFLGVGRQTILPLPQTPGSLQHGDWNGILVLLTERSSMWADCTTKKRRPFYVDPRTQRKLLELCTASNCLIINIIMFYWILTARSSVTLTARHPSVTKLSSSDCQRFANYFETRFWFSYWVVINNARAGGVKGEGKLKPFW